MRGMGYDRVEMPDEQDPARAGPVNAQLEVGRVIRRRARRRAGLGDVGDQRDRDRHRLLGAGDVARRRGHGDERLEVALGPRRQRRRVLLDPPARHQDAGALPCARAAADMIDTTSSGESTTRIRSISRSVSMPPVATVRRSQATSGVQ